MESRSHDLTLAIERLQQTPAPNYPITGYNPIDRMTLQTYVEMLREGSNETLELVATQVLEGVPSVRLSDEDVTADQLKCHYAVSSLRDVARDIVEAPASNPVATLFLKQGDFADELAEIRKGIEFVQTSVSEIKREIKRGPLDGISVGFGPIGVPLEAVLKAANVATGVLTHVAGVDAVALSLQLQGMMSNARLALRQALSLNGVPEAVAKLLRAVTERAAATAEMSLNVLKRAAQSLERATTSVGTAVGPARISQALGLTSKGVAIDFGTSKLDIFVKGQGFVGSRPIPLDRIAGPKRSASHNRNRWPGRPVIAGAVADSAAAGAILKEQAVAAGIGRGIAKPHALAAIPAGATAVERREMLRVIGMLPSDKITLIDAPIAAALGAGLDIGGYSGCMIGDIGAGKTEVSVVALSGIVYSRSVRVGGDNITEAIQSYLLRTREFSVPIEECEDIKIKLLNLSGSENSESGYNAIGFNKKTRISFNSSVSFQDIRDAVAEPIYEIVEAFKIALEATPPEIANSIQRDGITLTGGGALLNGMADCLRDHTGMQVKIAADPASAVIRGLGRMIEDKRIASMAY